MNKQIPRNVRGFSLIEVMIAVIVLAIGLLSLAALQGELFRSGAEAKARANAATIAQQVMEDSRTFGFIAEPNVDYVGNTYNSLADSDWSVTAGGVEFAVTRDVMRYRFDKAANTFVANEVDPYAASVPEFKMVRVNVAWTDSNGGNGKSIQMSDSIAAISPSDVTKVMEGPSESAKGPEVWIEPPNKGNPRVVPIAIGDNESAASSNPTPEQFVEDVSAVTHFSVMSFIGDEQGDEVLLNRKLDMAAASCVCQDDGDVSTTDAPAYQPAVWNGIQLAYEDPMPVDAGAPVGAAVVANADSQVEPICTICCRDHHVVADRVPAADPYRAVVNDSLADHYGYKKQGSSFDIEGGLLPTSDTGGLYLDACQLTRVAGKMRMTVDAMQTALVTTALSVGDTGYQITDFGDKFSSYVTDILTAGLGADAEMPAGYPSPTAVFPPPTSSIDDAHSELTDPVAIDIAEGDARTLVSFGVYVDYLSDDTLLAYKCALDNDNEDDCAGLGDRNPLEVLPFYAINVASLGDWESATPLAVSVEDASYSNQGKLSSNGGSVLGESAGSDTDIPVTLRINKSNTGLTGTTTIDFDDEANSSYHYDPQDFAKTGAVDPDNPEQLLLKIASASSINNLTALTISSNQTPSACNAQNGGKSSICYFQGPLGTMTVRITNYTAKKQGNSFVYFDRQVCVPSSVTATVTSGAGTMNEVTTILLGSLGAVNYSMDFAVVDGSLCSSAIVSPLKLVATP